MKHIVQEVLLVLIITIISIVAALFIAHSVRSETMHEKVAWNHSSDSNSRIHKSDNVGVADIRTKDRL